jgi:putative NADH-flavin reductase
MHISIIGAGAGIGRECVRLALAKGHTVTALSTHTEDIPNHPRLRKINGSATVGIDVKEAIAGSDAVLITVGTKKKKGTTLFSKTAQTIIQVADEVNFTEPILVITGFGAGISRNYLNLFMRMVIRFLLREQYQDKTLMEQLLTSSKLTWEIVRPGILTNGVCAEEYQVKTTLHKGMKIGRISRADVAHYLITEAEKPLHLYHSPALTY